MSGSSEPGAEPADPTATASGSQRRMRRIAMTEAELDRFLTEERTCRVATTGPSGPHATPLWFIWHDGAVWLSSLTRSQRWSDLQLDPRIGLVVDAGELYQELRGVEITGRAEVVGEVPRTGQPHEQLDVIEAMFDRKYAPRMKSADHDDRHAWLRIVPGKIVSWDFRKISQERLARIPGAGANP